MYKYRGRDRIRPRPFGGVNALFFGDLWQLPRPQHTRICSNPNLATSSGSHRGKDILDFFWSPTREWGCNGSSPYNFTVSKRLDNKREDAEWSRQVVEECRQGQLNDVNYHFMHGYETWVTGSWLASTGKPHCEVVSCHERCAQYKDPNFNRRPP